MTSTAALTATLTEHLTRGHTKRPVVCQEIALAGSWGSHGRLDLVALHWGSNWTWNIDGYEIKVSRQDFTRDLDAGKYQKYLPSLDRLFFAAPKGLIRKDELPPGIGLIVWSEDGASWSVVKRADRNHDRQDTGQVARILRRVDDQRHEAERQRRDDAALQRVARMFDRAADLERFDRLGGYWLSDKVREQLRTVRDRERRAKQLITDAEWRAQRIVETAERQARAAARLGPAVALLGEVATIVEAETRAAGGRYGSIDAETALSAIKAAKTKGVA